MRGRVQGSRAPVIVFIVRVYVRARLNQKGHHVCVTFPNGTVQGRRPIFVTRVEQRRIIRQQIPKPWKISGFSRFDNFFPRIRHLVSANRSDVAYGLLLAVAVSGTPISYSGFGMPINHLSNQPTICCRRSIRCQG
jgi:hypothetical protein